jgi:hypothetical protein
VLLLFGGNMGGEVVFASVLGASALAVGYHVSFANLLAINVLVGLFGGLMPLSSIGITEEAFTAGLMTVGCRRPTRSPRRSSTAAAPSTCPPLGLCRTEVVDEQRLSLTRKECPHEPSVTDRTVDGARCRRRVRRHHGVDDRRPR